MSDQNQKSKSSSEEVLSVETEDDSSPSESITEKYSEEIINNDPSSAIKIISAPDLSQIDEPSENKDSDKNKHNIKHIDSFPNFGKFILDNDPWVDNFISKVEETSYQGADQNSLEQNDLENHQDSDNERESKRKLETQMTPEQLEGIF